MAGMGFYVIGSTQVSSQMSPVCTSVPRIVGRWAGCLLKLMIHPDAERDLGDGKLWNDRLKPKGIDVWLSNKENGERLYNKLLQMAGEEQSASDAP